MKKETNIPDNRWFDKTFNKHCTDISYKHILIKRVWGK